MSKIHTLKWFQNRIGKRVFRNKSHCQCATCKDVYFRGLIIHDDFHAKYLFDMQGDLGLFYRDKK